MSARMFDCEPVFIYICQTRWGRLVRNVFACVSLFACKVCKSIGTVCMGMRHAADIYIFRAIMPCWWSVERRAAKQKSASTSNKKWQMCIHGPSFTECISAYIHVHTARMHFSGYGHWRKRCAKVVKWTDYDRLYASICYILCIILYLHGALSTLRSSETDVLWSSSATHSFIPKVGKEFCRLETVFTPSGGMPSRHFSIFSQGFFEVTTVSWWFIANE